MLYFERILDIQVPNYCNIAVLKFLFPTNLIVAISPYCRLLLMNLAH